MMQDPEQFDLEIRSMLQEAEEEVPAGAWEAVSGALDKKAQRAGLVVFWRRASFALAAAAALVAGIFLFMPKDDTAPAAEPLLATAETAEPLETAEPVALVESPAETRLAVTSAPKTTTSRENAPVSRTEESASKAVDVPDDADDTTGEQNAFIEAADAGAVASATAGTDTAPKEDAGTVETAATPVESTDDSFDLFHPDADLIEVVPQKQRGRLAFNAGGNLESNASPSRSRFTGRRAAGVPTTGVSEHGDNSSYGIPLTLGLGVKWNFARHWALGTGLGYSYLSRSFTGTYTEAENGVISRQLTADIDNGLHYIGIPLNLYFELNEDRPVQFYTFGGMTLEKGIKNSFRIKDAGGDVIYRENIDGIQLSFALGLGVSFSLTDHVSLYLDPSLRYYLENGQPKSIRTAQPLMMSLEAGLRFDL